MHSRIAPTPSGYLHLGNAFSFLLTSLLVRRAGGKLLLRIDDLDAERKRPEYVADIFESLHWLNIGWDEGPRDADDFEANWSQRLRIPQYEATLQRLERTGKVFACSCTRSQLAALAPGSRYPGICESKGLPLHEAGNALRFFVAESAHVRFHDMGLGEVDVPLGKQSGSFVVRRRDGIPAYHVASLTDDLDFGIGFVVRGSDLVSSTASQLLLAEAIGAETFRTIRFLHHPLLTGPDGKKLSKSAGALALKTLREEGMTAGEVYRRFAVSIGLDAPKTATMNELQAAFADFDPAVFRGMMKG